MDAWLPVLLAVGVPPTSANAEFHFASAHALDILNYDKLTATSQNLSACSVRFLPLKSLKVEAAIRRNHAANTGRGKTTLYLLYKRMETDILDSNFKSFMGEPFQAIL